MERMNENESEDTRDIQIIQVGQIVNPRKKHLKDGSQINDSQSQMSGFGMSQYGMSQSGFSMMGQSIATGSTVGPNGQKITFLKNSHQNNLEQLEAHKGYLEAKKAKEQKEKQKKQEKEDKKKLNNAA